MPDIFQTITSGFYDSVNKDRLYTADQMNMPYKKLITDGVYEESGTGAAFSVTAAGGMKVTVAPGNAMIGGKWAENEDAMTVEISGNTSESARVDSIILRLDANMETRAAGIVYRQGETAAPALDTSAGVKEFRLANITVPVNAASISDANITDTRGGSDCPWVRSVVAPSQTEVPDGSITAAKFTSALRAETIKDYVTPQMFGYTAGADLGIYLQAAVDSMESGTVFIPAGSYTMGTGVVLKSNITIMGDPSGETEISHTSAMNGTPLFTSSASAQNDHIHIYNISFFSSGERTAFTLLFSNTAYFRFMNNRIGTAAGVSSYFHGLRLQLTGSAYKSTEPQICNNIIVGELDMWASDALIENNILWGYNRDGALLLRNGVHAMIRGNQFIGGRNGSIYILSTNTHTCDDASIIDNYFDGSYFDIDGNWGIKVLTKMVNCRIIGNNFWRQKKGAIYGTLQSCLIQNNCFVDNDAKNEGVPDIWIPMLDDVFSNVISGNLFRRDNCFDTSGNWIARTVAEKPYVMRFYNNQNHPATLVTGNMNETPAAYDTIYIEGSNSRAVIATNVELQHTGGIVS